MPVGIAGYGLSGRSFHAPLLKGCGFEVAAVLTGNPTRITHHLFCNWEGHQIFGPIS